ncbi:hypothetical protein DFH09DRAFT_1102693 [Mycena vulgaris]|nr:hypothetical protein DFH09DRAFT_1102693 [Mycena vulgaris]
MSNVHGSLSESIISHATVPVLPPSLVLKTSQWHQEECERSGRSNIPFGTILSSVIDPLLDITDRIESFSRPSFPKWPRISRIKVEGSSRLSNDLSGSITLLTLHRELQSITKDLNDAHAHRSFGGTGGGARMGGGGGEGEGGTGGTGGAGDEVGGRGGTGKAPVISVLRRAIPAVVQPQRQQEEELFSIM